MAAITLPIAFKQGLNANLPASAPSGEPLWTTDQQELFIGTGASRVKVGSAALAAGLPYTAAEQTKLAAITATGSGSVITAAERANIVANTAAVAALGTTYQVRTEKGAANGYASLDAGSKIPSAQLPAVALTEPKVYADIAARDADNANVQAGDVAIVTAEAKSYMRDAAGTAWLELLSPGLAGVTFNGRAGPTLAPAAGDYAAGDITVTPAGNLAANTAAAAFTEHQGDIDTLTAASHTHAVPAAIPSSLGTALQVWTTNAGVTAGEWTTPAAGITAWTGLSDTPGAITAANLVAGNAGGTDLEFVDGINGGTF